MRSFPRIRTWLWATALGFLGWALPATARAGACQAFGTPVELTHEVKFGVGIPDQIGAVSVPLAVAGFFLDQCEDLTFEVGTFGVSGSHTVGNSDYGVDFDFSVMGAASSLVDMLTDPDFGAEDVFPSISANCTFYPEILRFSGGPSAYTFQIGDPGGPNTRTAGGRIEYCDLVGIGSATPTVVELPYDISVAMQAAEGFGSATETRGFAEVNVLASIGGIPVLNDLASVESTSVIPEQNSLNASGLLSIPVSAGVTTVEVSLVIEMKLEVAARSTGLFGSISGAAEAGITVPSAILGNFQGPGGAPLPDEMHIVSLRTGATYKPSAPTAVPAARGLQLRVQPNPFTRGTTLGLRLPGPSPARLRIVDVRGRLVKGLEIPAGDLELRLVWDGRDTDRRRVPAGVYFAILEAAGARRVQRMVRLR